MRKRGSLILVACLLILSGCSILRANNRVNASYQFNRAGIIGITGTAQMAENVKHTVIPEERIEELVDQIEGLRLKATDEKIDNKGWQYLFTVAYEDGNAISITLSEEKIVIDGRIYRTTLYHPNDFLAYFE